MLLHILIPLVLNALALNAMPGGQSNPTPFSQASVEVRKALDFAVCTYSNSDNSADQRFELGDLSDVTFTEQVVAGMRFRFDNVPLMESACPNNGDEDCAHSSSSPCDDSDQDSLATKTCDFDVQWKNWEEPKYTVLNSTCS